MKYDLNISDFDYDLPDERIAYYPLARRDQSKLLVFKDGVAEESRFDRLPGLLPKDSVIFMNDTKVIHARLRFRKSTGANIEVFCLEPLSPTKEVQLSLQSKGEVTWKSLVGNSKRWKDEILEATYDQPSGPLTLQAIRKHKAGDHSEVTFRWTPPELSFAEILEILGNTPLPPYIQREAEQADDVTYQTVYAAHDGSVAAPTAGLHFTPEVLSSLKERNIPVIPLTLHVGAGTFKPVTSEKVAEHEMHPEEIHVSRDALVKLLGSKGKSRVVIGTTSARTLESLYWQGVKWMKYGVHSPELDIEQWDPYGELASMEVPLEDAVMKILEVLDDHQLEELHGRTKLMIMPGYNYRVADILVTNFHQPRSTLLLLIAAFLGADWKKAYSFALENHFRFLSYGDSCLFYKAGQ